MEIVECPHCFTRVVAMADGTCPSCRGNVNDNEGLDLNMTALCVREGTSLPRVCFRCGAPATDSVSVRAAQTPHSGSGPDALEVIGAAWGCLFALFVALTRPKRIVRVILPRCELCRHHEPEMLYANFDESWIKVVVHKRLSQALEHR